MAIKSKLLKGAGAIALTALIAGAIYSWSPFDPTPNSKTLAAAAPQYSVEIARDEWGVPHIMGVTDIDASFGLGFANAEDDLETLQEVTVAVRGEMARHKGKDAAVTDYLVSLMDIWPRLDARYETDIPKDVKAKAQAFADGVNLYASQNPETLWPGLFPITDKDIIAGFMMKTPFFYGFDAELLKLFADERTETISLDPAEKDAFLGAPHPGYARGSNAFAVSPERSGDGVTRLFINSHQPLTGPVAWYEAHMMSEEGLNIQGGLFPGTPIVLSGFNKHLAWANTVSNPDLVDVFVLTVNPDNSDQYWLDGQWVDFEKSQALIKVKLLGPFAIPVKRKILRSVHGPVIESEHGTYAVKYAGMNEVRQLEQYIRLSKTDSLESFMEVMSMNALPSINYVYGDKDGNIGLIHNGQYPDRAPGWNWQHYLPGDRSDLNWTGYRPFSAVPRLINPVSGFVWNANNDPSYATDGPDNLRHDAFPSEMGLQTNMTNRARRIVELTDGSQVISRERLLSIKFDNHYAKGSITDRVVSEVLALDFSGDARLQSAQDHLRQWDYSTNMDNRHAALGVLTTRKAVTEKYTGDVPPTPEDAFIDAVELLEKHYGKIDPQWGDLNRLTRGDSSSPISGAPDVLRAVYANLLDEKGQMHMTAGDSYIALVEWDDTGAQSAQVIQPFGSNIENSGAVHHNDQIPIFASEQWRDAYLSEAEVRKKAKEIYRPGER